MATVCYKKLQGIPLPGTPFKLKNLQWGRFEFVYNARETLSVLDDTNLLELFFQLIPAGPPNPQRYIIKSLNTNLAITDNSNANGSSDGLEVNDVDCSNERQIWSIEPSSKYPTGYYRIKNLCTKGYLLNVLNDLRTFDIATESEDQNWTFIFTECQGIPPIHTEMRIRNYKTSRIVFTDSDTVFVRDAVSNLKEQVFMLVPSRLRPESYLIQSVNTGACLEDVSDGSGVSNDAVVAMSLDHTKLGQVWSLLPVIIDKRTYRILNCATNGHLLNGPNEENNLRTYANTFEFDDQCWTFLHTLH